MVDPAPYPGSSDPFVNPGVGIIRDKLIEQRRILVNGPLDQLATTHLAAQLMMFDGSSSRDVEIVIASSGGAVADAFAALDVLGLMRAKVNVAAIGSIAGTAVALVAACSGERRATARVTFSLRLEENLSIEGTAPDLARHADELLRLRARYTETLATATGQDEELIATEIDRGRMLTAGEAVALGIIDSIAGRP